MRTSDFDYHLPSHLIAQTPVDPRDSSRLLVLDRSTGGIEHRQFTDILECLRAGDLMVFNRSRVIPARLRGRRAGTGGRVELLLLRRQSSGVWEALGRPGRRLQPGVRVLIDGQGRDAALEVEVLESRPQGTKLVRLSSEQGIDQLGRRPCPLTFTSNRRTRNATRLYTPPTPAAWLRRLRGFTSPTRCWSNSAEREWSRHS